MLSCCWRHVSLRQPIVFSTDVTSRIKEEQDAHLHFLRRTVGGILPLLHLLRRPISQAAPSIQPMADLPVPKPKVARRPSSESARMPASQHRRRTLPRAPSTELFNPEPSLIRASFSQAPSFQERSRAATLRFAKFTQALGPSQPQNEFARVIPWRLFLTLVLFMISSCRCGGNLRWRTRNTNWRNLSKA